MLHSENPSRLKKRSCQTYIVSAGDGVGVGVRVDVNDLGPKNNKLETTMVFFFLTAPQRRLRHAGAWTLTDRHLLLRTGAWTLSDWHLLLPISTASPLVSRGSDITAAAADIGSRITTATAIRSPIAAAANMGSPSRPPPP